MVARFWNALRREPLVHFLALAALLFVTYDLLMPFERESLVIDRASIDELVEEQTSLLGRPLTDEERSAIVERAIDNSVLQREAYKRGLDRDAVVQRHLVQKMRFVLGEEVPEPSEAELRAYLAANRERYRSPPTVTLDHLFYADPAAVPEGLLAQLQNGMRVNGLGDPLSTLGDALPRYTLRDLMGVVGPDAARVRDARRRMAGAHAVRARRPFHARRGAPSAGHAEFRGAGELSPPGLDVRAAAARDRRQARRPAPGLPDRGRAGALIWSGSRSAGVLTNPAAATERSHRFMSRARLKRRAGRALPLSMR